MGAIPDGATTALEILVLGQVCLGDAAEGNA
jgi:hypothetical protein